MTLTSKRHPGRLSASKMTGRSDPRAGPIGDTRIWCSAVFDILSFPQKSSCLCYFSNGKPEPSLKFNERARQHAYHLELCHSHSGVKRLSSRRGRAYQRAKRRSSPQLISEQTYEIYNSRREEPPSSKLILNHWTWEVMNSELSLSHFLEEFWCFVVYKNSKKSCAKTW